MSRGGGRSWCGWVRLISLSHHLGGDVLVGVAPVAQFSSGPSGGQGRSGACRSEGLTVGQHVPDRLTETAADLDRGDLAAAFLAVPFAHAFADGRVGGVAAGGVRGFDQGPAQVVGAVLAQRAAPVAFTGLVDARSSRRSWTIWYCVVTSRPVVGSSAIRSRGRAESARATMIRCAIPPESSCG